MLGDPLILRIILPLHRRIVVNRDAGVALLGQQSEEALRRCDDLLVLLGSDGDDLFVHRHFAALRLGLRFQVLHGLHHFAFRPELVGQQVFELRICIGDSGLCRLGQPAYRPGCYGAGDSGGYGVHSLPLSEFTLLRSISCIVYSLLYMKMAQLKSGVTAMAAGREGLS
jgi:hypothetical protein